MRALLITVLLGLLCLAMTSCPSDKLPEGAPANATSADPGAAPAGDAATTPEGGS